jgi:hypothetical protein
MNSEPRKSESTNGRDRVGSDRVAEGAADGPPEEPAATTDESVPGQSEFKITVRKLDFPVRPRGVLAE